MLFQALLAVFVYPGLLTMVGIGVLYTVLITNKSQSQPLIRDMLLPLSKVVRLRSGEGALAIVSIITTAIGLALMPWPLHPFQDSMRFWLWSWLAFEVAFVIPVLPGLFSGWPPLVRAASRELQIGVTSRSLLWVALAVGIILRTDWSMLTLSAHLLAISAAMCALPAAIGWGPFASETSVSPAGVDYGLDQDIAKLAQVSRLLRVNALTATCLIAILPVALPAPWIALWLFGALFALLSLVLSRLNGLFPRITLPAILWFCWWRVLPLSAAAVICLIITGISL